MSIQFISSHRKLSGVSWGGFVFAPSQQVQSHFQKAVERFGQLEVMGCRVPVGKATAAWEELNVEAEISGVKEVELCKACMAVGWTLGKGGCLSLLS